ncbi:partitioning defective 6 homolog beta-like isoform X2 [Scleropages formosus]|uniref:partitioning defective 6 homolog beta-like isoform X2 n=1 Tax=Scleropages formosus TaxID=113540 RepID=UPI0010FAC388|nr:partitioning defective 6 homolog beta-like isoform X2 [Scleropages formosus]
MIRKRRVSESVGARPGVEVKSKSIEREPQTGRREFGAEFRRFSLEPSELDRFHDFYSLLQLVHRIPDVDILVGYADTRGGMLPITNDDSYRKAVSSARPLLRIFLHRKDDADPNAFFRDAPQGKKQVLGAVLRRARRKPPVVIGLPRDFRPVSAVLDADVLPAWLRRVRLHRRGSDHPLGFYIRDGTAEVLTSRGVRRVPGVFISRVAPGGLAHSSGLLSANDQVLEVNGVPVAGKSLDQVTDMMVANSHNLIVTVRPADQRHNVVRPWSGADPQLPFGIEQNFLSEEEEESEEEDLVTEAGREPRPVPRYELHLGLRPAAPRTPSSSSVGSQSTVDSGQGAVGVGPDPEEESKEEPKEESSSGDEGVAVTL